MTSRLYVRRGGAVGAATTELTGFTGRKGVPFFDGDVPLIQMGMRCANGEASQGTFKLTDPDAELPRSDSAFNLPAHALVTWTEDAPGSEIWLSRGRNATYEGGRGTVTVDNQVEYDATVDDGNMELRGQAFTEEWERPEEDVEDRLIALQAYTLNGESSTATNHRDTCEITVDTSHLVNIDPGFNSEMPAKTYPVGTQPQDVLTDCADTFGYIYSVVIHHDGGSHLCLLYILETDHATYASPVKISDHLDEWDPTDPTDPVYEPHWEAGKASLYDGDQLLTGLVNIFNNEQTVFDQIAGAVDTYDYWVDAFYDADSATWAQSADRLYGLLAYRGLTHVTHRVSIIMLASQLDLVCAGMSLQIKAAAAIAGELLDTWQTRRIAECMFEPRIDGTYWAHLQLDRTPRNKAYSSGKIQSAATAYRPPGVPIPPTDPDDCSADICEVVPNTWVTGDLGGYPLTIDVADGAVTFTAPQGVDEIANGEAYQTNGNSPFPPLVAGDGQLRGMVTLPELDDDVVGADIRIIMVSPASGSSHGAGGLIIQSQGLSPSHGVPFVDPEITGRAIDANLWVAGGSSTVTYSTPLFGTFKYAIRFCDGTTYFKLWRAGVVEPAAWEGPGNTATPDAVRISVSVFPRAVFGPAYVPFSDDFVWHFTRPTWCTAGGMASNYYYTWTTPAYVETADGSTATFYLPADPVGGIGGLTAYVNGNYEPAAFDSGARTFTLANAPEEGDIIDAAWIPIP